MATTRSGGNRRAAQRVRLVQTLSSGRSRPKATALKGRLESAIQVTVGKPVVLELPMADQTFSLHGIVVRTDRLPAVGTGPNYLLVVELAWHTVPERLQIAGFINAIRRSTRTA